MNALRSSFEFLYIFHTEDSICNDTEATTIYK